MALACTSNDATGSVPGGPEGCFGKPTGPPSDDFKRQISDASTTAPDTPMYCGASPDSSMTSFLPMGLTSPMMHYDLPDSDFAETSSGSSSPTAKAPQQIFPVMADEARFQMQIASALFCLPPTEEENEAEAKAVDVGRAESGEDADDEEDEVETHADGDMAECVNRDGITWLVARGRPPTMSQLEDRLAEVKSLYKASFGEDVNEEEDEDEVGNDTDEHKTEYVEKDGITWLVARGRPPTMSQLEEKLAEVKSLYTAKFGDDVDEEEEEVGKHADEDTTEHVVEDGITWLVARGRPPTMSQLEDRLAEVKSLYKAKFGDDVDEEEEEEEEVGGDRIESVEKDGITWLVARGRPPTMSQLEDRLAEVKSFYKAKFGEDVNEEDDEEEEEEEDEETEDGTEHVVKDGITWLVARGRPPTMSQIEERLAEVKFLYKAKFGDDVDEEQEVDEDKIDSVQKDGITWLVARGRPPTVSQLEDRLAEVKSLYKAKFGEDVNEEDDDEEVDGDRIESVEKDGITWLVARGRPPTVSQLEDRLAAVKSLYKAKFGEDVNEEDDEEDVDEEEETEDGTEHVVKDGITWLVARGRPPTMSQLEGRLAEVKSFYKARFGEDAGEEEDEDEAGCDASGHRTERVDKDGITWLVARGRPPTVSQLEDKLAEVKSLYRAKFGEDVDEEEEDEQGAEKHVDEYGAERVEKDGITWLVARGRPPTMSQLEDRLAEVKSLYKAKFGEDLEEGDKEEAGEHADEDGAEHVEKDGTTWLVARGRPPTMSQIEERLAEVKFLYKAKFGDDVDEEQEDEVGSGVDEDGTEHVVKDGITWLVARGRPPTLSQLEGRLAEVKSLYKAKFGDDVDEEEEAEEKEVGKHADDDTTEHVVKDGMTWVVARGRPPTMLQLEDRLAEVKCMYAAKFGRGVDDDEEERA